MAIPDNLNNTSCSSKPSGRGSRFYTELSNSDLMDNWIEMDPGKVVLVGNAVMQQRLWMMIVDLNPIPKDGESGQTSIEVGNVSTARSNILILVAESDAGGIIECEMGGHADGRS